MLLPYFLGFEHLDQGIEILIEDDTECIRGISMHIDQYPEMSFRTTEHPVDRPFLIPLNMVIVEFTDKISSNVTPELLGQKIHILPKMVLSKSHSYEFPKPADDVVVEPFFVHYWYYIVLICRDGNFGSLFTHFEQIIRKVCSFIRQNQPLLIQTIPPKHTPHRITHYLSHHLLILER